MSIIHQSIVFDDSTLKELEGILCSKFTSRFIGENVQKQMRKACQDYRVLKEYLPATGLTEQVIYFLLDPASATTEGIQSFFDKLEIWVIILPREERELYDSILEYYEPRNDWDDTEIAQIRDSLMSIILDVQPRLDTKIPMQLHPKYEEGYSSFMMNYGSEFDKPDSAFNKVPNNIKGKIPDDSFSSYVERFGVPS